MKKLTLLLCVFFAGISYAEEDNKTHDDKLKHTMYDMSVIEKQLEAYKKENGNYPTTEEGLGFTGSGEGISSQAICILNEVSNYQYVDVLEKTFSCGGCGGCCKK